MSEEIKTVTEEIPKAVVAKTREPVSAKGFLALPKTLDEMYRVCTALVKSGMIPNRFKTPEEVMGAMMYAAEHFPNNPITAMRQIANIEGTPTMFGDLPLSKVRSSGLLEFIDETYFDKEGNSIEDWQVDFMKKLYGAKCSVKRKGEDKVLSRSFTMDMKAQAGLGKTKSGNPTAWDKYPHVMLKYRARGSALKDKFADVLVGIAQGGYDVDPIDVTESGVELGLNGIDKAAALNEKFKNPPSAVAPSVQGEVQ